MGNNRTFVRQPRIQFNPAHPRRHKRCCPKPTRQTGRQAGLGKGQTGQSFLPQLTPKRSQQQRATLHPRRCVCLWAVCKPVVRKSVKKTGNNPGLLSFCHRSTADATDSNPALPVPSLQGAGQEKEKRFEFKSIGNFTNWW